MKKSFDEYKELYEKTISVIEEGPIPEKFDWLLTDFEVWVTCEWLKDRFPSMKKSPITPQESLNRMTYFKKKIKERLIETYKEDPKLGDVLKKGFEKIEYLIPLTKFSPFEIFEG